MRTICRVCDSTKLEPVIDLGNQPWCNHFLKKEELGQEPFYPLRVVYCHNCSTVQLDFTVKKEIMFGDHTYLSGVTGSLSQHFKNVAQEVDQRFFKHKEKKSVLDIGSNDGTQLKHYKNLGYEILGVESSKTTSEIAQKQGIDTLHAYFNYECAQQLNRKFDIINASGVFFHLEELHSVTRGIKEALLPEGVFVVQFLYMQQIIKNLAFDQIYHEHLLYYNLKTIEVLLNRHGLAMFDAYLSPIHGGSIIGFITHQDKAIVSERLKKMREAELTEKSNELETYQKFAKAIEIMKKENILFLQEAKNQGKKVYGFGAPVKGNTLLNYFGIGTQYLDCLVEKNKLRKGLFSPGMHIPLLMEEDIVNLPDIYYVLAWNFKDEILANNQKLIAQGVEFYFPVNPQIKAAE